jgi:hypothetical protein
MLETSFDLNICLQQTFETQTNIEIFIDEFDVLFRFGRLDLLPRGFFLRFAQNFVSNGAIFDRHFFLK